MKQVKSEMAGTILEIKVKTGDTVQVGQEVAVVESMKMEVGLAAKISGKVTNVLKATGDFLNDGEALLELE